MMAEPRLRSIEKYSECGIAEADALTRTQQSFGSDFSASALSVSRAHQSADRCAEDRPAALLRGKACARSGPDSFVGEERTPCPCHPAQGKQSPDRKAGRTGCGKPWS